MKILDQAILSFLSHCEFEKQLSQKTLKAYKIDLKQFNSFVRDNQDCQEITSIDKSMIRAYIQFISSWKPKTVKRKIACTKALFNFLEFDDFIEVNPFRKVKIRIKEPRILPTVMDIPEIKNILTQVYNLKENIGREAVCKYHDTIRDLAVLELLFATGIRVSELVGLKEKDVDLNSGVVKVYGKGRKERIIQICNKEVLSSLNEYYSVYKQKIKNSKNYFFINRLNNPLSDQSVRHIVRKYASLARIKKHITPHVFRHSFATLLLEEDVDIKYIQHMLGHSSIATTQIYTHVNQEKQRKILRHQHPRKNISMTNLLVV